MHAYKPYAVAIIRHSVKDKMHKAELIIIGTVKDKKDAPLILAEPYMPALIQTKAPYLEKEGEDQGKALASLSWHQYHLEKSPQSPYREIIILKDLTPLHKTQIKDKMKHEFGSNE